MKYLKRKDNFKYDVPDGKILDTFPSPGVKKVELEAIEFTSLCPITGQPDYGVINIYYEPVDFCLESKSLKMYLNSFRQYGAFAESIVMMIFADILIVVKPKFLKVEGLFTYRGGISIKATMDSYKEKRGA